MWNDPIVEETRAARDVIAARFDYDFDALMDYLMSLRAGEMNVRIEQAVKQATVKRDWVTGIPWQSKDA